MDRPIQLFCIMTSVTVVGATDYYVLVISVDGALSAARKPGPSHRVGSRRRFARPSPTQQPRKVIAVPHRPHLSRHRRGRRRVGTGPTRSGADGWTPGISSSSWSPTAAVGRRPSRRRPPGEQLSGPRGHDDRGRSAQGGRGRLQSAQRRGQRCAGGEPAGRNGPVRQIRRRVGGGGADGRLDVTVQVRVRDQLHGEQRGAQPGTTAPTTRAGTSRPGAGEFDGSTVMKRSFHVCVRGARFPSRSGRRFRGRRCSRARTRSGPAGTIPPHRPEHRSRTAGRRRRAPGRTARPGSAAT